MNLFSHKIETLSFFCSCSRLKATKHDQKYAALCLLIHWNSSQTNNQTVKHCGAHGVSMTPPWETEVKVCLSEFQLRSLCVIVAWLWTGVARMGPDPTGDGGFSDLAQHLADRSATVVRGCYSLTTALCSMRRFWKCGVSEKKVHCSVWQRRSECLPKRYAFTKAGLNIASAEVQCKCV